MHKNFREIEMGETACWLTQVETGGVGSAPPDAHSCNGSWRLRLLQSVMRRSAFLDGLISRPQLAPLQDFLVQKKLACRPDHHGGAEMPFSPVGNLPRVGRQAKF